MRSGSGREEKLARPCIPGVTGGFTKNGTCTRLMNFMTGVVAVLLCWRAFCPLSGHLLLLWPASWEWIERSLDFIISSDVFYGCSVCCLPGTSCINGS